MPQNKFSASKSLHSRVGISKRGPNEPIGWHVARYHKIAPTPRGKHPIYKINLVEGDFSRANWACQYCSGRASTNARDVNNGAVIFLVVESDHIPEIVHLTEWKYNGPT